jgi:hypothetical protein
MPIGSGTTCSFTVWIATGAANVNAVGEPPASNADGQPSTSINRVCTLPSLCQ